MYAVTNLRESMFIVTAQCSVFVMFSNSDIVGRTLDNLYLKAKHCCYTGIIIIIYNTSLYISLFFLIFRSFFGAVFSIYKNFCTNARIKSSEQIN